MSFELSDYSSEDREESVLRAEFETTYGTWELRSISLHHTKPTTSPVITYQGKNMYMEGAEIGNVENPESYPQPHPGISILQIKKYGDRKYRVFIERIYTNDAFLLGFENNLRLVSNEVVPQKGEEVPAEYKKFFLASDFTAITSDYRELTNAVSAFKMVDSDTFYQMIRELEDVAEYTIDIFETEEGSYDFEAVAFEYKASGGSRHLVFRKQSKQD